MTTYTFQSLFDFTRTTSGTFVGSNGLIQTTPASVNLLTWTQEFDNAAWNKGGASVSANSTVAPDGTSTADTLTEDTSTGDHRTFQAISVSNATPYTFSVYVKPNGRSLINLTLAGAGEATYNISTGVVTNTASGTAEIQPAGSGWYRCIIKFTSATTSYNAQIRLVSTGTTTSYTGDGTSGIFIWGAQLQTGSTATDYTRNNGGVFPPRFDYDPVTLAPKGLLIEEQRTNLILYSEQFNNAAWTKSATGTATAPSVTANTAVAPDGTSTADTVAFLVIGTTSSDTSNIESNYSTIVNGAAYAYGLWVKASTAGDVGKSIRVAMQGFSSGSFSQNVVLTNSWQRVTGSANSASTAGNLIISSRGNLSQSVSVDLWGAQLEAGSFATSYIPTVASQVTRTADQCSIVAPMFAPWYNQSEGTFVFEGTGLSITGFSWPLVASDNTTANRLAFYKSGTTLAGFMSSSGATQMEIASSPAVANMVYKIAIAAQANSGNFSFNGDIGSTDTSITMPTVNKLSLGANAAGNAEYINGHIRSIRYYPVRLSNAQLQALTA